MSGIRIANLEKRFGQVQALYPSNLEIAEGELCVFVGPSGCGKTTFLRMIAGLEEATEGEIFIDNQEVTWMEPKKRQVAMVFQNYALYPHLTVQGNLEYPLNILRLNKEAKARRVRQVAGLLEIEKLLQRKPAQLSGGQRQRVAIGRALVREPKVFLFDEPLSNLDARLREQMRLEIRQLHLRLKRTSVYVTHDQHEAMTLGDKLVVMNQGRILEIGPPLELYRNPQTLFTAKFLGHPPINLFPGEAREGVFQAGPLQCQAPIHSGPLTLAIRPEDLTLGQGPGLQLQGRAQLIEHLGREAYVTLATDLGTLRLVTAEEPAQVGENLSVWAAENKILWFNDQEQRIIS